MSHQGRDADDRIAAARPLAVAGDPPSLGEIEREYILSVQELCGGNRTHAARQLGIGSATLSGLPASGARRKPFHDVQFIDDESTSSDGAPRSRKQVQMNHGYSGGKRQRETDRLQKQKEKAERLRRNREMKSRRPGGDEIAEPVALPEVKLEDVVLAPPPRPKRGTVGPLKLFVGGLSWDSTSAGLRDAFAKFGALVEALVIQDRDTGRSRGFGFVTFENAKDGEEALKAMSGAELEGRRLKVNRADAP